MARGCYFLQNVTLERRGIDYVVIRGLGVEHRKAVVMARGDGYVLGARCLDLLNPLTGIEFRGVETSGEFAVFRIWNLFDVHDPLAAGEH